jgi:hypothetical protein
MTSLADRLAPVRRRLGRIRGSIKRLFALDGLSRLVLAATAFVALTFLVDWALILPAAVRLVMLAAGLGLFAWVLGRRVVYPLGVRVSDDDLALFVEREFPELNDRLISAIQLARQPADDRPQEGHVVATNSPELVQALVEDAEKATGSMDFKRVLVRRHVGKILCWAFVLGGVLAAGAIAKPAYASIYLNRLLGGSQRWPQRTELQVLDFTERRRVVAKGDDLAIAVTYSGVRPGKVNLDYEYETGERGRERLTPMEGNRFQVTFTRVTGPFTFTVEGGDFTSDPHTVDTVIPPAIDQVRLFYEYPPYMRKPNTPPDRPETTGNVLAPFGTKVRFEAETNEDLKSASLAVGPKGKERTDPLQVTPTAEGKPRLIGGSFTVHEVLSEYALQLRATNGLSNRDPIRFTIKGLEDRPPDIKVFDPMGDEFVTEVCERPLEIEVVDDHGIARIALEYRVIAQQKDKSKDQTAMDFGREHNTREYGEPAIRSQYVLDISKFQLQAGDHVEVRFRAHDYKDIGAPNVKYSKPYKFSIVSMAALEKELQDAIEKIKILLKAQKAKQENLWNRSGNLVTKFGRLDQLAPEQQGEVRQTGLDQNDITSKLDSARKDLRHIMRRGVYNKIYNETSAQKLQGAIDELEILVGSPQEPGRDALSRLAAARLDQAARLKSAPDRTQAFRDAQELQNRIAAGIQRAIDHLDKWASYQEVIRIARDILEDQKRNNERIKQGGNK